MIVRPARNKHILKKRLKRFFDQNSKRRPVVELIDQLSRKNNVLVFGGCVRDIALFGSKAFDSDIDLVFLGTQEELVGEIEKTSGEVDCNQNRFGGFRCLKGGWQLDVWCLQSTWAFTKGYVKCESEKSLLITTITNWDAIYFSWKTKVITSEENYFADINDGYLNLVLPQNPNLISCLVRILRFYFMKQAHNFSPKLMDFMIEELRRYSVRELIEYEQRSYPRNRYLSESDLTVIKDKIESSEVDLLPMKLAVINRTLDLFSVE